MVGTETEIAKWMDEKREKEREQSAVAVPASSGSMSGSGAPHATPVQDLLNSNAAAAAATGTEVRGDSASGTS